MKICRQGLKFLRLPTEGTSVIEDLEQSSESKLGFKVSGDMTKADYGVLKPAVAAAITESGSISLVLDLTDFQWEKVSAWRSDISFGKEFHDKIDKMAIVGNKKWEEHLVKVCSPFYAKEAKYFETDDDAFTWIDG
jgi:hypothetical protein